MPSPAGSERRLHTPPIASRDELASRIRYAREHAAAVGRTTPLEVVFMPGGLDMFTNAEVDVGRVVEGIRDLAALGVTYLTVSLPGDTRAVFLDQLENFARDVLEPVRDL
jgi:hypothetical protein